MKNILGFFVMTLVAIIGLRSCRHEKLDTADKY
ncbi:hypothetical protein SMQ_00554 [Enterococcus faecium EnGen0183]|nr:hypothetical protein SMQ_00554 [Enterococcus faecium EnGen0183]